MLIWLVLLVVVVVVVALAVRLVHLVPSGHVGVVQRGGAYVRLVTPGLLVLRPGETVRSVPSLTQHLAAERVSLPTAEGDAVRATLRLEYRVEDPVRALTAVDDAAYAVERDATAALRSFTAGATGTELVASSVPAAEHVRADLAPRLHRWGLELLRVEVVVHADAG